MSSNSGVRIAGQVIDEFNALKLKRKNKYIIFKLSDDLKEVVVEHTSPSDNWEEFTERLIGARFKTAMGETACPRYALYDFQYETAEGPRNKLTFVMWSPDNAGVKPKMIYASSAETFKRCLNGVHVTVQANDGDDLEYKSVLEKVKSA